jgi:DNA-binding MarR family transcriptional regulator
VNIDIDNLNKAFENRIRLGIMAILAVHEAMDFIALKEYLEVTDGNLASHLKALEKEAYICVEKSFIGRKPNTRYSITPDGKTAFQHHIAALENLIRKIDDIQT